MRDCERDLERNESTERREREEESKKMDEGRDGEKREPSAGWSMEGRKGPRTGKEKAKEKVNCEKRK